MSFIIVTLIIALFKGYPGQHSKAWKASKVDKSRRVGLSTFHYPPLGERFECLRVSRMAKAINRL